MIYATRQDKRRVSDVSSSSSIPVAAIAAAPALWSSLLWSGFISDRWTTQQEKKKKIENSRKKKKNTWPKVVHVSISYSLVSLLFAVGAKQGGKVTLPCILLSSFRWFVSVILSCRYITKQTGHIAGRNRRCWPNSSRFPLGRCGLPFYTFVLFSTLQI